MPGQLGGNARKRDTRPHPEANATPSSAAAAAISQIRQVTGAAVLALRHAGALIESAQLAVERPYVPAAIPCDGHPRVAGYATSSDAEEGPPWESPGGWARDLKLEYDQMQRVWRPATAIAAGALPSCCDGTMIEHTRRWSTWGQSPMRPPS